MVGAVAVVVTEMTRVIEVTLVVNALTVEVVLIVVLVVVVLARRVVEVLVLLRTGGSWPSPVTDGPRSTLEVLLPDFIPPTVPPTTTAMITRSAITPMITLPRVV